MNQMNSLLDSLQAKHPSIELGSMNALLSKMDSLLNRQASVTDADLVQALCDLSQCQSELINQIKELDAVSFRSQAQDSLSWQKLLENLAVPIELSADFEVINQQFQGQNLMTGLNPIEGWKATYHYYNQVCQYLDCISAYVHSIHEDPEYLPQALKTLELRAQSRKFSQGK